jgi:hypothetical protein
MEALPPAEPSPGVVASHAHGKAASSLKMDLWIFNPVLKQNVWNDKPDVAE